MPMTIRGKFRGFDVAIRLTKREAKIFRRACSVGFLVLLGRLGPVELAWEVDCGRHGLVCIIIRRGRSTASITLDLAPAGLRLDENAARDVRMILFRASCKAPNPAAKGRIRRRVMTPTYVYARVPVACAEATARALLAVAPSRSRTRRALSAGQGE
jgi:hypothetical protein